MKNFVSNKILWQCKVFFNIISVIKFQVINYWNRRNFNAKVGNLIHLSLSEFQYQKTVKILFIFKSYYTTLKFAKNLLSLNLLGRLWQGRQMLSSSRFQDESCVLENNRLLIPTKLPLRETHISLDKWHQALVLY